MPSWELVGQWVLRKLIAWWLAALRSPDERGHRVSYYYLLYLGLPALLLPSSRLPPFSPTGVPGASEVSFAWRGSLPFLAWALPRVIWQWDFK